MALMQHSIDEDLAQAFYELLTTTPVLVPATGASPVLVTGPSGESALPVFLDEGALSRWTTRDRIEPRWCSIQQAAQLLSSLPGVLLVVDLGSSPGSQPIARHGVELLAMGSYPFADRHADRRDAFRRWAAAIRQRRLASELEQQVRSTRVITIGSMVRGAEVSPNVYEVEQLQLLSVRGPDGGSYVAAWPTVAPSFAFMPDAERRLTLPASQLVEAAIARGMGLVLDPGGEPASVPPAALAAWWGA